MWSFRPTRRGVLMGGLAIGVGFGLAYLFDRPGWWDAEAILDADFANGRFRWDGLSFDNETAFLAAIGGSKAGAQRTFGPYVDPAAVNLISNGTFDTDLSGWTPVLNGVSTAAVVSGAAHLTSDGTSGTGAGGAGITQAITTEVGEGYLEEFTRAASQSGSRLGSTALGFDLGGISANAAGANINAFNGRTTTSHIYHFRTGSGSSDVDNVKVRKAAPFKGFVQNGNIVRIAATTPAAASGEKCVFSYYNSPTHDIASVFWNASGELRVRVTRGAVTQADLNLGVISPSSAFELLVSFKLNAFYAQLTGGPTVQLDLSGDHPGVCFMKIGESPVASTAWDGSIGRVRIYAGGGADLFYSLQPTAIHAEGDSFIGGAGGINLPTTLQGVMSRPVYSTGAGGNTMDQISARLVAAPAAIKDKVTVIWDGDNNSMTTVSAYADLLAIGLAGISRFVVLPTCVSRGQSDVSAELAVRDEFLARWPNNFIDWRNVLPMNGDVPADAMFRATDGSDNIHLSQAAMDLMAVAIASFITAKGW